MTDLIEKYQEQMMEHKTETVDLSSGNKMPDISLSSSGSFTIRDAQNKVVMEVNANGDIHFYGNLVVHGNLVADGDIRAARVFNAVFN